MLNTQNDLGYWCRYINAHSFKKKMLNTQNGFGYWCRYINAHSLREKCSTHKTVWDIGVGISMLTALGTSSEGIVVGYVLPCYINFINKEKLVVVHYLSNPDKAMKEKTPNSLTTNEK